MSVGDLIEKILKEVLPEGLGCGDKLYSPEVQKLLTEINETIEAKVWHPVDPPSEVRPPIAPVDTWLGARTLADNAPCAFCNTFMEAGTDVARGYRTAPGASVAIYACSKCAIEKVLPGAFVLSKIRGIKSPSVEPSDPSGTIAWHGQTELQQDTRCYFCDDLYPRYSSVIGGDRHVAEKGLVHSSFVFACPKCGHLAKSETPAATPSDIWTGTVMLQTSECCIFCRGGLVTRSEVVGGQRITPSRLPRSIYACWKCAVAKELPGTRSSTHPEPPGERRAASLQTRPCACCRTLSDPFGPGRSGTLDAKGRLWCDGCAALKLGHSNLVEEAP